MTNPPRALPAIPASALLISLCLLIARLAGCNAAPPPAPAQSAGPTPARADPYLWLQDITSERALQWVHQQNDRTSKELESSTDFEPTRQRLLSVLNSDQRIPYLEKHGKYYYNFWRDARNVRGLWRRTTLEEYRKPKPAWETVLDLDALAGTEKTNWVWHGANVLKPSYDRCLIMLSSGGADATAVREFDLDRKQFVADGFNAPEAKNGVAWRDRDTLYIGTDWGADSLTKSGYPRSIRQWSRGQPLADARTIFQTTPEDVGAEVTVEHDHGRVYEFIVRGMTAFSDETLVRRGNEWVRIEKPADAQLSTFKDYLLLRLRSDWTIASKTWKSGSLLAANFDNYLQGDRNFSQLFVPGPRKSLLSTSATKNYLLLNEMDNVRGRAFLCKPDGASWATSPVPGPELGTVTMSGVDPDESDDYFLSVEDFLTPSSLYLDVAGQSGREPLKSLPAFFSAENLQARQFQVTSKDGTRIPYFQVSRKEIALDGNNPTLLYGYGGFEISVQPGYRPRVGIGWLERGGVYVLANIRGGGEFGPAWHNAARRENRQRAYDDFQAVAQDLIARKVTSPRHLGIQGGSNGGLLVGVMLTQRPGLFGAVVCQAPLLDMQRYNHLLAGASWMDEYGNPDIAADWDFIQKYSPYQNTSKDRVYPPVLFTTSTRDDRVHPGHARKMAALLQSENHVVLFYENTEGGHAGAANNIETAYIDALAYTFLHKELK